MNSMTGFGTATVESPFGRVTAEIRSVNSRYLETNFRLGSSFQHLETNLRNLLREKLSRGKVDLTIRYSPADSFVPPSRVNVALLTELIRQIQEARPDANVTPEALVNVPGVIITSNDAVKNEELDAAMIQAVELAMVKLEEERRREGDALRATLNGHQASMAEALVHIESARDEVVAKYRERLHARMDDLLGPKAAALDPGRLEQEVAIFCDKADIAEECDRLRAHLEALSEKLARPSEEALGRALEFLSQEILREVNTIGSKCRDLDITQHVLILKQSVESLREMLANVE